MEMPKRPPSPLPIRLAFWAISVICLVNINHFLNMTMATGWPATLALTICCTFLCLVVGFPWEAVLGRPGFLILATLTSYLLLGLSVALVTGSVWHEVDILFPLRIGLAALTIVATAGGASIIVHQVGIERLLKRTLAIMFVTCTLILASPLLVDYVYTIPEHLPDLEKIAQWRFIGTSADPNIAGMACCYAVVLALSLMRSSQSRSYPLVVLILATTAGVLTFSRVAILTLGIIFVLFICLPRSRGRQKQSSIVVPVIALATGVAALLAVNLGYIAPKTVSQLNRLMSFTIDGGLQNARFELWTGSLSEITESPVFGHGLMRFHHLEWAPPCVGGVQCGSHNVYLMFWGEAGIIPLLLFLLAITSFLWTSLTLPQSPATRVVTGWIVVFALACIGMDSVPYLPLHNFILGLSCALLMQTRRESQSRRSAA